MCNAQPNCIIYKIYTTFLSEKLKIIIINKDTIFGESLKNRTSMFNAANPFWNVYQSVLNKHKGFSSRVCAGKCIWFCVCIEILYLYKVYKQYKPIYALSNCYTTLPNIFLLYTRAWLEILEGGKLYSICTLSYWAKSQGKKKSRNKGQIFIFSPCPRCGNKRDRTIYLYIFLMVYMYCMMCT